MLKAYCVCNSVTVTYVSLPYILTVDRNLTVTD